MDLLIKVNNISQIRRFGNTSAFATTRTGKASCPGPERRKGASGRRNTTTEPLCSGIRILQRISGALTPGIRRQICLWETLTKKFENIGRTPQLIKIYVY